MVLPLSLHLNWLCRFISTKEILWFWQNHHQPIKVSNPAEGQHCGERRPIRRSTARQLSHFYSSFNLFSSSHQFTSLIQMNWHYETSVLQSEGYLIQLISLQSSPGQTAVFGTCFNLHIKQLTEDKQHHVISSHRDRGQRWHHVQPNLKTEWYFCSVNEGPHKSSTQSLKWMKHLPSWLVCTDRPKRSSQHCLDTVINSSNRLMLVGRGSTFVAKQWHLVTAEWWCRKYVHGDKLFLTSRTVNVFMSTVYIYTRAEPVYKGRTQMHENSEIQFDTNYSWAK